MYFAIKHVLKLWSSPTPRVLNWLKIELCFFSPFPPFFHRLCAYLCKEWCLQQAQQWMITCTHQVPLGNALSFHNLWEDALPSKRKYWDMSEGEQLSGLLAHGSIVRAVWGVCRVPGVQFLAGTPLVPLELCWQKTLPRWRSCGFNLAIPFQVFFVFPGYSPSLLVFVHGRWCCCMKWTCSQAVNQKRSVLFSASGLSPPFTTMSFLLWFC